MDRLTGTVKRARKTATWILLAPLLLPPGVAAQSTEEHEAQQRNVAGRVVKGESRDEGMAASVVVKGCSTTKREVVEARSSGDFGFELDENDCDHCKAWELTARPESSDYLAQDLEIECTTVQVEIPCPRRGVLLQQQREAIASESWGLAALRTNELLGRERLADRVEKEAELEETIYVFAANYFDIPKNQALRSDPVQGDKVVMSPVLVEAISLFQVESGIAASEMAGGRKGTLDFKTLKTMAEWESGGAEIGPGPYYTVTEVSSSAPRF